MNNLTIHERVVSFLQLMTGPTPQQCQDDGLDGSDSFHPMITEIFSSGCCGNLAIMLQLSFGGQLYLSDQSSHVVTNIGDRCYDVTGDVTGKYGDLVPITAQQLHDQDFVNNYSLELRGPII